MNTRYASIALALALVLGAGCSDDSSPADSGPPAEGGTGAEAGADLGPDTGGIGNDVAPQKIVGGGTGGGAIDGRLNVYVLDAADDSPLSGALVMLDDGSVDQGTTDKDGLITFRRPGLAGPVTVTAGLPGHVTSTVVGLDAANFTATLSSRTAAPTVKTGTCNGTVQGWASLPALAQNHVRIAYAGYLLSEDLGDPDNDVQQPQGDLNLFAPALGKTTWTVTVPAKDGLGIYVAVLDVDTKGNADSSDDTHLLTHVGVVQDLKVGEGQLLAGIKVPLTAADDTLTVNLPTTLPAGTDTTGLGVLVQLASGDLLPVFFNTSNTSDYPVPKLAGDFAGGNYWVIATAEPQNNGTDENRQTESLALHKNITDASKAVEIKLLELPTALKLEGRTLSFSGPAKLELQSADLMPETAGAPYWSVAFVDAAPPVSYTLPALPQGKAEDLPQGKLFMHVSGLELPGVDLNNARFKELVANLARSTSHGAAVELK